MRSRLAAALLAALVMSASGRRSAGPCALQEFRLHLEETGRSTGSRSWASTASPRRQFPRRLRYDVLVREALGRTTREGADTAGTASLCVMALPAGVVAAATSRARSRRARSRASARTSGTTAGCSTGHRSGNRSRWTRRRRIRRPDPTRRPDPSGEPSRGWRARKCAVGSRDGDHQRLRRHRGVAGADDLRSRAATGRVLGPDRIVPAGLSAPAAARPPTGTARFLSPRAASSSCRAGPRTR